MQVHKLAQFNDQQVAATDTAANDIASACSQTIHIGADELAFVFAFASDFAQERARARFRAYFYFISISPLQSSARLPARVYIYIYLRLVARS